MKPLTISIAVAALAVGIGIGVSSVGNRTAPNLPVRVELVTEESPISTGRPSASPTPVATSKSPKPTTAFRSAPSSPWHSPDSSAGGNTGGADVRPTRSTR